MQNEIIINADPGETRVAVMERSSFSELHIERRETRSVAGSVIKGRVTRVLPGMQASFVDIGLEKAAFLYAGDYFDESVQADAAPRRGRGRNGSRREPPRIDTMLSEGQEIVVQVAKEPIGTKGARIISHISIPGRHLVLTPWSKRVGVSRRIDSDRERRRLREIVNRLRPADLGFIIRTAGDGVREADLEADIRYLAAVWEEIRLGKEEADAPAILYSEPDLPLRVIRDFANSDTRRVVIDSPEVHANLTRFVERYVADPQPKIERYAGDAPIFDHFGLEQQIHGNLQRKVWLKSGGSLIIDQSEALTAIDVNTGRYVGKRDLEETVLKTNLEAVKEVVHQLRFRNIGGLIIIDLIDMESQENREKVYRALQEAIRGDKAKTNILKISELGLVEMTRKRTRENLVQTLCEPCGYCEGRGYVLSAESVAFKVLREIRKDLPRFCGRSIAVTVAPPVAEQLLTTEKQAVADLSEELGREIEIRAKPGLHQEQFEVLALDQGPAVSIPLRWLGAPEPEARPVIEEPEPEKGEPEKAGAEPAARADAPVEAAEPAEPAEPERAGGAEPVAAAPAPEAAESAAGDEAEAAVPSGEEGGPEPAAAAQTLDEAARKTILPPSPAEPGVEASPSPEPDLPEPEATVAASSEPADPAADALSAAGESLERKEREGS
ncbi:MAG: Rne/Rng family ribonuclease [Myxococcota bacterium]